MNLGLRLESITVDLQNPMKSLMVQTMNAAEIIEEIAQLSESEKVKVVEFVRHLPNAETIAAINEPTEGLPRFNTVEELFEELNR